MRSDGLLLASLILRRDPARRKIVREALAELGAQPSLSEAGQALIRAKVIAPKDFLLLRELLEEARRPCRGCGAPLVLLRAARCARCGKRNPAVESERVPASRRRGRDTRRDSSGRNADQTQRRERTSSRRKRRGSERPHTQRDSGEPSAELEAARLPDEIGGYKVLAKAGHGGMGVIYRVTDETGRTLALKRLRPDASEDARQRFRREAEAVARLRHPAIVQIHDVGEDAGGLPFYTMDFVEGRELQEVRHELPRARFLEIVAEVARGLHYAHEQGIIHRDVKPHNIMLDKSGTPRIADFGLARDLGRSSLTEVGDLVGTPLFMAPEQLRGDPSAIDRRTDVYALGVVLYEGLTRKLPIEAGNFFELQQRIRSHIPDPPSKLVPELPPELDRIVLTALEKRQDDRYPSAEDLARDLDRFLAGESVEARGVSPVARLGRQALGWLITPWGIAALVCVLLSVIGGVIFAAHLRRERRAEAERAALRQRQSKALVLLERAQASLQDAHSGSDSKRTLELADEALQRAEEAAAAGEALGADAPAHVTREVAAIRLGARRLRAETLARGTPSEREAARHLFRGLLEETGDPDLRLLLGRLELEGGHCRAALAQFNEVLAQEPDRAEAFYYRAEAHRRAGAAHYALLDYERALRDRSKLVAVRAPKVLVGRALAHLALGETSKAREDLSEANKLDLREPLLRLGRAELYRAEGRLEDALTELAFGARTFPRVARLRHAAGRGWIRAGDPARAQAELDAAAALGSDPAVLVARARLAALLGRDEAAQSDLAEAAERTLPEDPARAQLRLVQARLLRVQGREREALAALREVLERDPPLRAELEAAELALAVGSLGEASDFAQRALARQAGVARATLVQARVFRARGDDASALSALGPLLEREPGNAEALTLRAQLLPAGEERQAVEARATEAQRLAVNLFGGLDLEVSDPVREGLSSLLRGRRLAARAAQAREEPQQEAEAKEAAARSLALLRRAVRLAPWLGAGHLAQAQGLARSGEAEQALGALEEALSLGVATVPALRLQARLLAEAGRHAEALAPLGDALERINQDTPTQRRQRAALLLGRARSLLALGRKPEALLDLDAAVELDPLLLEAFAARSELRDEAGNAAGAEEDRRQVEVLRRGYVRIYERAKAQAWAAAMGRQGDHVTGIRALEPAFAVVSRQRDPRRKAELHLVRAYMRVRSLRLAGAMIDWAALIELAGGERETFRQIYDEAVVFKTGDRVNLHMESIIRQVIAQRDTQDEVDPDFLQAFSAFAHVEFGGKDRCPAERLRQGIAASARYLERRPAHPGMLLLRAVLLLTDGRPGPALSCVAATLEAREPPPFAYYVLARIQNVQRDRDGALRSLSRALDGGFDVYVQIEQDPLLAEVRAEAGFKAALALGRGRSYLRQIARAEEVAARDEAKQRLFWDEMRSSASAGIEFVLPHLRREGQELEPKAAAILARLYLARGRQQARLRRAANATRDLLAAVELDPELLADVAQLHKACRVVELGASAAKAARPRDKEPYPSELREAFAVLLRLLYGGAEPEVDELTRARGRLEEASGERAELGILLAPLRQAEGNAQVALELAQARREPKSLARWFVARALAKLGKGEEAMSALREAKRAGLRGPLDVDPALRPLVGERFRLLFPSLPFDPQREWGR